MGILVRRKNFSDKSSSGTNIFAEKIGPRTNIFRTNFPVTELDEDGFVNTKGEEKEAESSRRVQRAK